MQVNQKRRMGQKRGVKKLKPRSPLEEQNLYKRMQEKYGPPKTKKPKKKMPKRMPSGDSIIRRRSTEKEMPGPAQRKLAPKAKPKSKG